MIEPTEDQWYQDEDEDIHSFLGDGSDAVDCPQDDDDVAPD